MLGSALVLTAARSAAPLPAAAGSRALEQAVVAEKARADAALAWAAVERARADAEKARADAAEKQGAAWWLRLVSGVLACAASFMREHPMCVLQGAAGVPLHLRVPYPAPTSACPILPGSFTCPTAST